MQKKTDKNVSKKNFPKSIKIVAEGVRCYQIKADHQPLETSEGSVIQVPSKFLATAIADELKNQLDKTQKESTTLFKLASIAIDQIASNRESTIYHLMKYAETDLLCYWREPTTELGKIQSTAWSPLLKWAEEVLGARMKITCLVSPVQQSRKALTAIKQAVEGLGPHELAPLVLSTQASGSIIVGLAIIFDVINIEHAIEISQLDEIYQEEKWGSDVEMSARRNSLSEDLYVAGNYIKLLKAN